MIPVVLYANDPVAAYTFTAPTAPLHTSVDGTDHDEYAVSPTLPSPLLDDNTQPLPLSVVAPTSSAVVLDKDALGAIPPALTVHQDSVARQMDSGPQAPSAMPQLASGVAGDNRAHVPLVLAAALLLSLTPQTVLSSLLPSELISSRARRRRAATASKPQDAVDYGFNRSDPTP